MHQRTTSGRLIVQIHVVVVWVDVLGMIPSILLFRHKSDIQKKRQYLGNVSKANQLFLFSRGTVVWCMHWTQALVAESSECRLDSRLCRLYLGFTAVLGKINPI